MLGHGVKLWCQVAVWGSWCGVFVLGTWVSGMPVSGPGVGPRYQVPQFRAAVYGHSVWSPFRVLVLGTESTVVMRMLSEDQPALPCECALISCSLVRISLESRRVSPSLVEPRCGDR